MKFFNKDRDVLKTLVNTRAAIHKNMINRKKGEKNKNNDQDD